MCICPCPYEQTTEYSFSCELLAFYYYFLLKFNKNVDFYIITVDNAGVKILVCYTIERNKSLRIPGQVVYRNNTKAVEGYT